MPLSPSITGRASVDGFPPPLTPEEAAALRRRQRGKNRALLLVLVALAALFYAISFVRMDATTPAALPKPAAAPR